MNKYLRAALTGALSIAQKSRDTLAAIDAKLHETVDKFIHDRLEELDALIVELNAQLGLAASAEAPDFSERALSFAAASIAEIKGSVPDSWIEVENEEKDKKCDH